MTDSPANLVEESVAFLSNVLGRSESTVVAYRKSLADFRRRMEIENFAAVTIRDADSYMARLALARRSPNTRRLRMSALKAFYSSLASRGHIPENPLRLARAPEEKRRDVIPVFSREEIGRIVFWQRPLVPQRRKEPAVLFNRRSRIHDLVEGCNSAMVAVVYQCALRAGEPGRLRRSDLQIHSGQPLLVIRESKRSREPQVFALDDTVCQLLQAHLIALESAGVRDPALFPRIGTPRGPEDRGVSSAQFAAILQARVEAAGIEPRGRHLSPHVLRYSRCTHLYERQFPIFDLAAFMRHRSVATTWRYVKVGSIHRIQRRANWRPLGPNALGPP